MLGALAVASGSGIFLMQHNKDTYDVYEDFKQIKKAIRAFRKQNQGLSKGIENLKPFMPPGHTVKLDRYALSMDDRFLIVKKFPRGCDPASIVNQVGGDSKFSNNVLRLSFYAANLGPEPEAVIQVMPMKNITTKTLIEYSHDGSTAENGEILKVEWDNAEEYFDTEGVHKVKVRVMDKHFRWSEWASKEIFVSEERGIKSLHGNGGHVMVLHQNGHVEGYGENANGQLGNCTNQNNEKIEKLVQIKRVETISAGSHHTLFLMSDKKVYATGKNDFGQLGIGDRHNSKIPKLTWGIEGIVDISAGNAFSAAVTIQGHLYVWGHNESKCLGPIDSHFVDRPIKVEGLENVKAVSLGNDFTLVLHYDGTVTSWGNNDYGQLGQGFKSKVGEPAVSLLKNIESIHAGKNLAYAITSQKKVLAFGSNKHEQLALEGEKEVLFPVEILGLKDIVKVVSHQNYTLALDERGNVYCWGQFSPVDTKYSIKPVLSEELKYVQDIAVASKYGYALMEDGSVYEFGSDFSEMRKLERGMEVKTNES